MSDYCDICKVNFGDPGYYGCGPTMHEWSKHYQHLMYRNPSEDDSDKLDPTVAYTFTNFIMEKIDFNKYKINPETGWSDWIKLRETDTKYYLYNKDTRCSCRTCGEQCGLLMPVGGLQVGPAGFAICWNCQSIGEIGKGPVPLA